MWFGTGLLTDGRKKNWVISQWNRLKIGVRSILTCLNMKPTSDKLSEVVKTWFLQSRGFPHEIRVEIPYSGFSHNVFLYWGAFCIPDFTVFLPPCLECVGHRF